MTNATEMRTPIAFSVVDDENEYLAATIEDAAERYLDGVENPPEVIQVQGYATTEISDSCFEYCIEGLVESLEENYGDPDRLGDYQISKEAHALFKKFKDQVIKEFPVYVCETVGCPIEINTAEFIRKHWGDA